MDFLSDQNLLSLWNNIKESVRVNTSRSRDSQVGGLDYSFITPTLMALGKLPENKVDELVNVLTGNTAVLWNLSGKPFSAAIKSKLNAQVLDASWVTPGQFTQAPSLECIFAHCYGIKSWLDLKNDHVAIIHCGNGRSRSGILIACLLKYIGAFDHATHAFDFFCGARLQTDSKPSLAPSYRILFENIDKAVDQGGYPNPQPMHFKCLAISGLPVDEIPCVEVWDMYGQVFVSHVQWKHTNKCTWSADYGDGFFRVSTDIYGDFSVMVRFGGHHALTRDKTTLIFKYQNSTAFLPPEVVELKRQNVDVNPEYSDSLDVELFAVHLMFENAVGDAPRGEFRPYRLQGREAFEAGLDEISKQHSVEPDSAKTLALANMGFPDQYTSVALQLANNSLDQAAEIINSMKARAQELDEATASSGGDERSTPARRNVSGSALAYATSSPSTSTTGTSNEASDVAAKSQSSSIPPPERPDSTTEGAEDLTCPVCREDNILKRDQLVPCTQCGRIYHTACFGARRIPFTLKTPRERQNRDKYVAKHYGLWLCAHCDPVSQGNNGSGFGSPLAALSPGARSSGNTPNVSSSQKALATGDASAITHAKSGQPQTPINSEALARSSSHKPGVGYDETKAAAPWSPSFLPSGAAGFKQGGNASTTPGAIHTPAKTKHDQAAILMGLLAASGITVEQLMDMGEDKQKEALIAAASMYSKPRTNSESAESVAVSSTSARLGSSPRQPNSPPAAIQESVLLPPPPGQGGTILQRSPPKAENKSITGLAIDLSASPDDSKLPPAPTLPPVAAVTPAVEAAATVAVPVIEAPSSPPAPSGRAALMAMLAKRANQDAGVVKVENPITAPAAPLPSDSLKLQDDPRFQKYIKMVKVGLPKGSVAAKMHMEGAVSSIEQGLEILSMAPDGPAPPEVGASTGTGTSASTAKTASGADSEDSKKAGGASGEMVPLCEHPAYAKFFKMLKVGLPREKVRQKMQEEGKDLSYLDKDPQELVPLVEAPVPAAPAPAASSGVAVSEHPTYSKYFRMLKVGLPKDAIKAKMEQEGVDPSFLDKDASELVGAEGEGAKVPVSEHPQYAKYFKMLGLGLPKDAVRAKITLDGLNTSYLDLSPQDLVLLEDARAAAAATSKVAAGKPVKGPRKKKLHWKGLDASKVGRDSLWADKDDTINITLDEAEFNQLFVESDAPAPGANADDKKESSKKKRINLIDMKRGQNGGIALARIKLSFPEVKEKVALMEDEGFTTDQLRSLEEYLPTKDEMQLLKGFSGDKEMLGRAEKYMLEMMNFPSAAKRIQCMVFKQQFKGKITESKTVITKIENACDDVKMSVRLKKVLKTILKVGNQMNDGADSLGFTLDSLLKLQSAKAFDKKTSILQYVIMLIQRNDENCLLFPEDLVNVTEASRLTMESVQTDHSTLRQSLDHACRVVTELLTEDSAKGAPSSTGTMSAFLVKARQIADDLDALIESVRTKYTNVLNYFGESPDLSSSEFFSTLSKFVAEFVTARDQLERQRKAEMKKQRDASLKESLTKNDASAARRASVQAGSTSQRIALGLLGVGGAEKEGGGAAGDGAAETGSPSKATPTRRSSMF